MSARSNPEAPNESMLLDLFFSRRGDAWQVFALPSLYPAYLREHFDENYEAYPVSVDFDDLERRMAGLQYEKRPSRLGGFQIVARGPAALAVAAWLTTAFASGVRSRTENDA